VYSLLSVYDVTFPSKFSIRAYIVQIVSLSLYFLEHWYLEDWTKLTTTPLEEIRMATKKICFY